MPHGGQDEGDLLFVMSNVCRFVGDLDHEHQVFPRVETLQRRDLMAELIAEDEDDRFGLCHFHRGRSLTMPVASPAAICAPRLSRLRDFNDGISRSVKRLHEHIDFAFRFRSRYYLQVALVARLFTMLLFVGQSHDKIRWLAISKRLQVY
jgi:hypothetical protein